MSRSRRFGGSPGIGGKKGEDEQSRVILQQSGLYAGRKPAFGFREKMDPQKPPVARDRKMTAAVAMADSAAARPSPACEAPAASDFRGGLSSRSFLGLLATQFLVALNDNMFRWLVVPIGKEILGPEHAGRALSLGLACFVVPYLLLAAPAGYLADRFSKRSVAIGCKAAEIALMILGIASILQGNIYLMFAVLALMGAQAALFSPAKMSSIPEIVRADRISAANGLIGLTTVAAIIIGSIAGGALYALTGPTGASRWWISAAALIGVAVVGLGTSLLIGPLRAADPGRRFPLNAVRQTAGDLGALAANRALLLAAMASAILLVPRCRMSQVNVDRLAAMELGVQQQYVGPLLAALAVGVGLGSGLAGVWSAGKIELGMVPWAAAGMAVSACFLGFGLPGGNGPWSAAYDWSCLGLLALGFSAGFFDVPLQAFLQHRSPPSREARSSPRAISSRSRRCSRRRAFSGWRRKFSTSPPGTSSSPAASSPCPFSS